MNWCSWLSESQGQWREAGALASTKKKKETPV